MILIQVAEKKTRTLSWKAICSKELQTLLKLGTVAGLSFKTINWFIERDLVREKKIVELEKRKRTFLFVFIDFAGEESVTVMEEDLRLCTVKPASDSERRFCFEVLSPSKYHMLQADSNEMYSAWISALQHGIGAAIQSLQADPDRNDPPRNDNPDDASTSSHSRSESEGSDQARKPK